MEQIINVTDQDFEEKVIEKSKEIPVVVDFWAEWCGPCFMLSPALEKFAEEYKGKFVLIKINVDNARVKAQEYEIMSIPAVKMFKNGKIIDEFIGAVPEQVIKEWLNKNLEENK